MDAHSEPPTVGTEPKEASKFGDIIVAVDDSGWGRDAITLARRLLATDGKLTLAHVLTGPAELQFERGAPAEAEERGSRVQRERAERLLRTARDESGAALEHAEIALESVSSLSVGRGLHELAESRGADLLVLGSSRRGLLGRVLVRDHTRAVLNGAPCAAAVAPAGYSDYSGNIRRIGVGYDGSLESEHALEVARELAAANDAELSACTAVSVPLSQFGPGPLPLSDAINTLLDNARERIAALGGVEPHAVYGATVEVLAGYSASLDLLVVGSRANGPVGRLVHGSTSDELARTARCALLLLPRSARTAARGDSKDQRPPDTMVER